MIFKRRKDLTLKINKVCDVRTPSRAHSTDAGIDFYIPSDFETMSIKPHESVLIKSGIRLIIPDGYALVFKEKSSIATQKKLMIGAAVVDSNYRGEVHFHLYNAGTKTQTISANEKIIQGVIIPILLCDVKEVSSDIYEKDQTSRGSNGFGSTINF